MLFDLVSEVCLFGVFFQTFKNIQMYKRNIIESHLKVCTYLNCTINIKMLVIADKSVEKSAVVPPTPPPLCRHFLAIDFQTSS